MCADVIDLLKAVALLKPENSLPLLTERDVVLSLCGLLSVISRHEQGKSNITLGKQIHVAEKKDIFYLKLFCTTFSFALKRLYGLSSTRLHAKKKFRDVHDCHQLSWESQVFMCSLVRFESRGNFMQN